MATTSVTLGLSSGAVTAAPSEVPPAPLPCEELKNYQVDVGPYSDMNIVHVMNSAITPACDTIQLGSSDVPSFLGNDPISPTARRKDVEFENDGVPFGRVHHGSITMRTADRKVVGRVRYAISATPGLYNSGWASSSSESPFIRPGEPNQLGLGGGIFPGSVGLLVGAEFQTAVPFCGQPAGGSIRIAVVLFVGNDGMQYGAKYLATTPCAGTTVTLATKSDFKQRDW